MPSARWADSTRRTRLAPGWSSTIRPRILKRDGHRCTRCGSTQRLEVHHLGDSDDHADHQLATLCHWCHNEETQREAHATRRTAKRTPPPHPGLRP